ncbi:PAS domain-containing protein [Methylorubrum aminovorans]|uniref:PAS domain-containing protein n=1 Tax=Methylorubrum aminovorans TaxID=269069 RepID=UPI003C2E18E4
MFENATATAFPFLAGGGQMGAMMRSHAWSRSPLGHPEAWPPCLRSTVSLMLGSRFPMFVAFGAELGFLYNDAYGEILGDKHPQALGRRFREVWPEIWPDIVPLVEKALSGEPTWSEDMPLTMNRRGHEEQTWFTFSYSPVRDEEGRVAGMFCACTETTGRVRAELGLRETEARQRALADHLPGGYVYQIATPRDGSERRFLYVSQGFERLTGLPAEAVLADPAAAYNLFLPEHRHRLAEAEAVAIRDVAPFDVEAPMRRPDGGIRWTRIVSAPRPVGDHLIWDGLHLDDTARRQIEEQLRESERRLRLATEAAEIGLWDVDEVEGTLFWPARVKAMFGISPDVPVTMADYYAGLHPDDREATSAAYAAAADPDRRAVYDVEYRTVGKEDGVVRWVAAKGRGIFEDGRCLRMVGTAIDITARKQAEAALLDREARLKAVFAQAGAGLALSDLEGRFTDVNETYCSIVGRSREQVLGSRMIEITHPDDRARNAPAFAAAARDGTAFDIEKRYLRPDGEIVWVRNSVSAVRFDDGTIAAMLAVSVDITDRVRAEVALRESEEQFRVLSQVMPNFVWATDAKGRATWFNERVYAYAGLSPGALDAEGWRAIIHPDDRDRVAREWLVAVDSVGSYQSEYRLRRADGVYRWFLGRGQPVVAADGAVLCWVGTSTDIDDQKQVMADLVRFNETLERRVAERTAEHDRVWRNSRDLLVVVGADGIFRAANPAWEAILGYGPAEIVGRHFAEFIWPDDLELTHVALESAVRTGPLTDFENRYRHKDGASRWISWRTAIEGDLVYAYGRDVTAEKAQGEALRQAEEALRQSQKLEAIGQLTGGVAHDFNNLLTIIRSSVDFLCRPDLPEERRNRYLTAVSETVDRAAKLTGQLLAFARRQALKPETIDVGARLRSVADLLDTVTGARIRVVTALPERPCFVKVDLSQFETALVNMAVNARDAMEGEGTLTLRLDCGQSLPTIRGHAGAPGPFAAVSLHDTGAGIAPDVLAHIFEPFFTTKDVGKGTGLGLSQVFGFAKQSGGDVAVESAPDRGTTFTLYLPQVEPEAKAGEERGKAGSIEPGGFGQQVLVVEDNIEVGRFATQILEDLGYVTTWAANADAALACLAEGGADFDAVFSDVVMPGMNGVALAHEINKRFPDLPVVLTSGYSHVLAQEGSHGFELLQKPYSAEQLSSILQRVTARRV